MELWKMGKDLQDSWDETNAGRSGFRPAGLWKKNYTKALELEL